MNLFKRRHNPKEDSDRAMFKEMKEFLETTLLHQQAVHDLLIHNHKNQIKIMADLSDLTAKVEANGTVIGSAIEFIKGIKQKLDEAGTDADKLKSLSDSLGAQDEALAAAIATVPPTSPDPVV